MFHLTREPPVSAPAAIIFISLNGQKKTAKPLHLFISQEKATMDGTTPTLLPLVNLEGYNSKQPFCSADGKYLFFSSDRPGGFGQFDIWYAVIREGGTIAEPVNAGPSLNSAVNEQAPFYHNSSNTLVFSSDRMPGMGGFDLFSAKGKEMQWSAPENMGHPINSSRDDLYFFAAEKGSLLNKAIISSDRGSDCCLETYTVTKTAKEQNVRRRDPRLQG